MLIKCSCGTQKRKCVKCGEVYCPKCDDVHKIGSTNCPSCGNNGYVNASEL